MKNFIISAVVLCACAAYAGDKKQMQMTADSLKWETPFGDNGPAFAIVSGDMKKSGPFVAFLKMKAGQDSGWHTHDSDYDGVVIKGTVSNVEQGAEADAKPLTAGSAWWQPAKKNHKTSCGADSECIVEIHMAKGFSFTPMTAEGKKAPMAAAPAKGDAKAEAKPAEMKKDAAAPKK